MSFISNMAETVTIYILAYNRPEYLCQCLNSISAQTHSNFKVVVLDNASQADLKAVTKSFADLNIDYIRHPKNLGSTGNIKYAWQQPKDTEFFMMFHDDDLLRPGFLQIGLGALGKNDDVAWLASELQSFKSDPPAYRSIESAEPLLLDEAHLAYGLMKREFQLAFSSVIYRSADVDRIDLDGLFSSYSIIFDRPMLFKLASDRRCAILRSPLVLYRLHPMQDSKTGPVSEDNLLALCSSYRSAFSPIWTTKIQKEFYAWSGHELIAGYRRVARDKKSSLANYLKKAREQGVYQDRLLANYLFRLIKNCVKMIFRAGRMLFSNPLQFLEAIRFRLR